MPAPDYLVGGREVAVSGLQSTHEVIVTQIATSLLCSSVVYSGGVARGL